MFLYWFQKNIPFEAAKKAMLLLPVKSELKQRTWTELCTLPATPEKFVFLG